jgi:hypothetical protein
MKILGLLLTAAAITQGAPFWFDLISKLSNPRSSGPVPVTSQEKAKTEQQSRVEIVRTAS